MKKLFKSLLAAVLCAAVILTSIGTSTAYAAGRKMPLKIIFNGKSINMVRVLENGDEESASITEVLKKFGEPDEKQTNEVDKRYTYYKWENGKSVIAFSHYVDTEDDTDILCHFGVNLEGRNDALCDIKIGMKMDKALKKLKKMFGKNNVSVLKNKNGQLIPKKNPTGNNEVINVIAYSYVLPLKFYLKNGRVSSMGFSS